MDESAPGLSAPSLDLPDDDKVEAVVTFLTESHLDHDGGYPHDHLEFRGWVFVADLCDGTVIRCYRRKTLIRWYDAAVRLTGEDDDLDIVDALIEADPGEEQP